MVGLCRPSIFKEKYSKAVITFVTAVTYILVFAQIGISLFNMNDDISSRIQKVFSTSSQIYKFRTSQLAFSKSSIKNATEKKILKTQNMTSYLLRNSNKSKFMLKMEERMKERKNRLEENCKKLGLWNQTPLKANYAVLKSYNLTYCFIPKVGCTNWKKLLMKLNKDTKDINKISAGVHAFVSQHYRVTSAGMPPNSNHFLKFLVVRHPLDRLYSAYINKFSLQADGTLPQFAKTSMMIHKQQTKHKADLESNLATFEEFIDFLTKDQNSNAFGLVENHWSTYNRLCQPCTIKYDVIAHLETIEEDSRYLLNLIRAPASLTYLSGYGKNGSSMTRHDNVLRTFSKFKQQTLINLHKAYQVDFDLFGYKYLN